MTVMIARTLEQHCNSSCVPPGSPAHGWANQSCISDSRGWFRSPRQRGKPGSNYEHPGVSHSAPMSGLSARWNVRGSHYSPEHVVYCSTSIQRRFCRPGRLRAAQPVWLAKLDQVGQSVCRSNVLLAPDKHATDKAYEVGLRLGLVWSAL
jgi:hypothetical protein